MTTVRKKYPDIFLSEVNAQYMMDNSILKSPTSLKNKSGMKRSKCHLIKHPTSRARYWSYRVEENKPYCNRALLFIKCAICGYMIVMSRRYANKHVPWQLDINLSDCWV